MSTDVWDSDSVAYRGHRTHRSATALVPGTGDTRFAPVAGADHAYLGRRRTVALLESALHHLSGPDPTMYLRDLRAWASSEVALTSPLRLIDLRDDALAALGIGREQLVDTDPAHYSCTRRWADRLWRRHVGGQATHGLVWHSRQADLHRRVQRRDTSEGLSLVGDLLRHEAVEVAVIWSPDAPSAPFAARGPASPLVDADGSPSRLVVELSALLRSPVL